MNTKYYLFGSRRARCVNEHSNYSDDYRQGYTNGGNRAFAGRNRPCPWPHLYIRLATEQICNDGNSERYDCRGRRSRQSAPEQHQANIAKDIATCR